MRGVPRERCARLRRAGVVDLEPEDARGAQDDLAQLVAPVEVEPLHDPEAVAKRRSQEAGARRRADQRERRQVELDRAGGRPLPDHDVELEVLERGIEDLLDHRAQAMDLVHEEDVARLEIGQDRGEVARPLEHGSRRLAEIHAELVRDDVRERRLAEARRAENQHVIERLVPAARRLDEDAHLLLDGRLADVLVQPARAHAARDVLVLACRRRCRDPVLFDHPRNPTGPPPAMRGE